MKDEPRCHKFGTRERCLDCGHDEGCPSLSDYGASAPVETTSPDVMEVWRAAKKAYDGCVYADIDAPSHSAAAVIAEAKARWEREAFEKAAQVAHQHGETCRRGDGRGSPQTGTARRIRDAILALKEPRP